MSDYKIVSKRKYISYNKIVEQLRWNNPHSGAMELLKVVMLVGGFVYVSMALSTEGAKKGMIYYIARMQYNCVHDLFTSVSPV